jgi:PhnB protein
MAQLNAYLFFNGNCREAMSYYKDALGGELKMMTVGESPAAASMPAEAKDKIMHATLINKGFTIMASDNIGGKSFAGTVICLCLVGANKKELEPVFAKLSAGGKDVKPLKEEFFGTYGECRDKFGTNWMFQAEPPKK